MKFRKRAVVANNSRRISAKWHARPLAPVLCPRCGSNRTMVYASNKQPVRYHRCLNPQCKQRFKSVEKVVRGEPLMKGE